MASSEATCAGEPRRLARRSRDAGGAQRGAPGERDLAQRFVELLLAMSHRVAARTAGALSGPDDPPPAKRSWCYGTVGVAAVLYDRAVLDNDDPCARSPSPRSTASSTTPRRSAEFLPSLCHGRGGPATVAWHLAGEGARFTERAAGSRLEILAEHDERAPARLSRRTTRRSGRRTVHAFPRRRVRDRAVLVDAVTAHERRWLPLLGLLPD